MPLMHSEDLAVQEAALPLFERFSDPRTADFARRHGLDARVRIAAQAMTTDGPSTFGSNDMRKLVGADMARAAAAQVYAEAGIGPDELDVIELHDAFTISELLYYEALGLCERLAASRPA